VDAVVIAETAAIAATAGSAPLSSVFSYAFRASGFAPEAQFYPKKPRSACGVSALNSSFTKSPCFDFHSPLKFS